MVRKFILLVFLLFLQSSSFAAPTVTAGNFTLTDLGKNRVSLSDFKGQPVILIFWTTTCPFCRSELKVLNGLSGKFKSDGVQLLTIDVGEPSYRAENFMKRQNFSFRVLLDEDISVAEDYGLVGVPTYCFISRQGHLLSQKHSFSQQAYRELLAK